MDFKPLITLLAILLLTLGNGRAQAWAPFIGLAGQPAWLYLAIEARVERLTSPDAWRAVVR